MHEVDSPAVLLAATFADIHRTRMADMPLCNHALAVETIEFAHWGPHWLGVLITPWCMNIVVLPREADRWYSVRPGDTVDYSFPAGVFGFIAAHEPRIGEYHACSLFSPMFEFADQDTARVAAAAARAALFDSEHRPHAEPGATTAPVPMTKRDFLRLPE